MRPSPKAAINKTKNKETDAWVTLEQLAGPNYLNSMEHAKVIVDSEMLTSRLGISVIYANIQNHNF